MKLTDTTEEVTLWNLPDNKTLTFNSDFLDTLEGSGVDINPKTLAKLFRCSVTVTTTRQDSYHYKD